jgi:hypothetical protein
VRDIDRRTWRRLRSGVALTVAVLGSTANGATVGAEQAPASAPAPPTRFVDVAGGQLTVDVRDADLADVLKQISERAGFELRTKGPLGHVTATFTAVSLEDGLRRLVQAHELMLVYAAGESNRAGGGLLEVQVFAAPSVTIRPGFDPGASATFAEINQLSRARDDPRTLPRLSELLGSAPEAVVRARAAWALGNIGGAAAAAPLENALRDPAPDVRVQAAYALGRIQDARAIPALAGILLRDSDVTVRRAAVRTLGLLSDSAATSALRAAAEDPDPMVRREVGRALQRHGVELR